LLRGPGVAIRGNVVINGVRVGETALDLPPPYPRLYDERGRAWERAEVSKPVVTPGKEMRDCTFTLVYRPPAGVGKAAKLSLYATEPAVISVPFMLKGVSLK